MTYEEALKSFKFKYEMAKDYNDPHWECGEAREHREYVEQLAIAIEAIEKQMSNPTSEWISVKDRLPECEWGAEVGDVAYYCKNSGYVLCGCFGRGGKYRDQYFRTWNDDTEGVDVSDVSYWMMLPQPPKESEI